MHLEADARAGQLPVTVRVFRKRFASTRRAAGLARRLAQGQLEAWGVAHDSEVSDTAALLVAELAANAVLHGYVSGRGFELGLELYGDDVLRIEVTDTRADRTLPVVASAAPDDAESGRGLLLVQALADHWGTTMGPPPQKTVWAQLTLGTASLTPNQN
ncbi:ATP-binding protein [Streptomyces sp. NPDC059928]|uniref:ATP-binding protein n=1 Tax=unclassified Streptomyces TaxID=2593676 RepID=UPI00365CC561